MDIGITAEVEAQAERRYVTILFADLVGYTSLSEGLDPEDLEIVQRRYAALTTGIMESFGGTVAQLTGDGVLVFFGYPQARETDVERALRAGLELAARVPLLDVRVGNCPLAPPAVRVGVHTGLVLLTPNVGPGLGSEPRVIGEAVNIASRLEARAPPGGVITSQACIDLVRGRFELRQLASDEVRGLSRRIDMFEVVRHLPARADHLERVIAPHLVGRTAASRALREAFAASCHNRRCSVVSVVGDAGVGKTRLLGDFIEGLGDGEATVIRTACAEIFSRAAFFAVTAYLWQLAHLNVDDDAAKRLVKIGAVLAGPGLAGESNVAIYESLLGPTVASPALAGLVPSELKRRQLEFLVALVASAVEQRPTLLWVDDAHWLDPSTAELLHELVRVFAEQPLFIVISRRSFPQAISLPRFDEEIALVQLDADQSLTVARSIPGSELINDALLRRAVEAAEGLPLFIEQFVVSLLDGLRTPATPRLHEGVPLMLASLLAERLDRRPGSRRLVQLAACVGRSFNGDMLAGILGRPVAQIEAQLSGLVDAELLLERRHGAVRQFTFRHALIQRFAYEMIVSDDRRQFHRAIANAIGNADTPSPNDPELRAHHLTEAGAIDEAIRAWHEVGLAAQRASAHIEAVDSLRRALRLLDQVEDPARRIVSELPIQVALMASLTAARGSTAEDVAACCERGLALCRDSGRIESSLPFAFGLATLSIGRGDGERATAYAAQVLDIAIAGDNIPVQMVGHSLLGRVGFMLGDLVPARVALERAMALNTVEHEAVALRLFGQSYNIHTRSLVASLLFHVGEIDTALEYGRSALDAASRLGHPHSTAIPFSYLTWVGYLGDAGHVLEHLGGGFLRLAEQHGLAGFRGLANGNLGIAMALQRRSDEAIAHFAECERQMREISWTLTLGCLLCVWADTLRRMDRIDEARAVYARAFDCHDMTLEGWFRPEMLRIGALIEGAAAPNDRDRIAMLLTTAVVAARHTGQDVVEFRCLESLRAWSGRLNAEMAARLAALGHCGLRTGKLTAWLATLPDLGGQAILPS